MGFIGTYVRRKTDTELTARGKATAWAYFPHI